MKKLPLYISQYVAQTIENANAIIDIKNPGEVKDFITEKKPEIVELFFNDSKVYPMRAEPETKRTANKPIQQKYNRLRNAD